MRPKLAFSIADLPLNISIEDLFRLAGDLNIDGVEILPGFKTFPGAKKIIKYSQKYNVPILSIHQPLSFEKYFLNLKDVFALASHFQAYLVIHPLKKYSLWADEQKIYFERLSFLSSVSRVEVLLENLPSKSSLPIYSLFSRAHISTTSVKDLSSICKEFGFGLTLDTSHLKRKRPQEVMDHGLQKFIKNIHLSDFTNEKQHLSIGEGELDMTSFVDYINKIKYSRLITVELSPRIFNPRKKYLEELQISIDFLKKRLKA